jgi:hypothetical protein
MWPHSATRRSTIPANWLRPSEASG